ncbi:hypothetical protein CYMTET_26478 [Cymbomonas tetramitiformis]|uniref:Uncharacterized protein n=1 Tax=Cymbomonas tetramitiformis TaxID=36881 RepID=A0AAE0KY71_9CHLO|nr:hypothetical protein CYMTET_26478 [Cymbomonas tetramitiformis]
MQHPVHGSWELLHYLQERKLCVCFQDFATLHGCDLRSERHEGGVGAKDDDLKSFLSNLGQLYGKHFMQDENQNRSAHYGTIFVTEDAAFATLFTFDDATASVRVDANRLLYSTLELLVDPNSPAADWKDSSSTASPLDGKRVLLEFARRLLDCDDPRFQRTSDLMAVRVVPDKDPHDAISDFNAALAAARSEVRHARRERRPEGPLHQSLGPDVFPTASLRLAPRKHFGDPPSHRDDGDALSDSRDMVLDLKRQHTILTTKAADESSGIHATGREAEERPRQQVPPIRR